VRLQARERSKDDTGDPGLMGHGSPVATVLLEALLTSSETIGTKVFSDKMVSSVRSRVLYLTRLPVIRPMGYRQLNA